jgi:hypothetical protein
LRSAPEQNAWPPWPVSTIAQVVVILQLRGRSCRVRGRRRR